MSKTTAMLRALCVTLIFTAAWSQTTTTTLSTSRISTPISFEPNRGQFDSRVLFGAHSDGALVLLTRDGAELLISEPAAGNSTSASTRVVKINAVGLAKDSVITGQDELPGKVNYLVGSNPSAWLRNIETFRHVQYTSPAGGIGLVFYGNDQHSLEYDVIIPPGADAKKLHLRVQGADKLAVDRAGDLVITVGDRVIRQRKPVAYSRTLSGQHPVSVAYSLVNQSEVAFKVGAFDKQSELVIDPVLVYSSYLGGGWADAAFGIATDSSGNAYVTGGTQSTSFPHTTGTTPGNCTPVATNPALCTVSLAFVTKINALGTAILWSTYLGGSNSQTNVPSDAIGAIVVGADGSVYVTGLVQAPSDFPQLHGFQGPTNSGLSGFFSKLSPDGSALQYSTLLDHGPVINPRPRALAVDSAGNAYVAGSLLTTNPVIYLVKIDPSLSGPASEVWFRLLSGGTNDRAEGVALDSSGNIYLTGLTRSALFPTTPNSFQPTPPACINSGCGFVAKLNGDGSTLLYSSYLGGSGSGDQANGIVVDSSGNATVTGFTNSPDFPTGFPLTSAFQSRCGTLGASSVFVTQMNSSGSQPNWSTCLGGTSAQQGYAIASDPPGNIYVTGVNASRDFPVLGSTPQNGCTRPGATACTDAFIAAFAPTGSLIYSTLIGGTGSNSGLGIASDQQGSLYVAGVTGASDFPVVPAPSATPSAFQTSNNAANGGTGFVLKIARKITTTTVSSSSNPSLVGASVTFTAAVTSPSGGTPSGNVSFSDGSTALGTAPLTAGVATFSTSQLAAGTHIITAQYSGDPDFSPSSGTISQVVNAAATATLTTITAAPNPALTGQLISLTVTITGTGTNPPSGSFQLRDGPDLLATDAIVPGVPTIVNTAYAFPGTHSFTATYLGDSNNTGSVSTPVIVTVVGAPTTTVVTGSPNPAVSDQNITFTAVVSAAGVMPTGLVVFSESTVNIGSSTLDASGRAVLVVPSLSPGTHSVTAAYIGGAGLAPSTSAPWIETVGADGFNIISTFAGNGVADFQGDGGQATAASLSFPFGLAQDASGNLYVVASDSHVVRRIDANTGVISTIAGTGARGFSGDGGPAANASLAAPAGIALDSGGNLFITEELNQRIRRIDAVTGIITTVVGNGFATFAGDGGPATAASINAPTGIAVDPAGNIFFTDEGNFRIRRVDATTGIISTIAGNGTSASKGDGGPATAASLSAPFGLVLDAAGNLFFADVSINGRVRKIDSVTGIITTVAGGGSSFLPADGIPALTAFLDPIDVKADRQGNLFIADGFFNKVFRIDANTSTIMTIAGNGTLGFSGDGGPAFNASLARPDAVLVGSGNNLFISDQANSRVRRVPLLLASNTPAGSAVSLISNGIPFNFTNVVSAGSTTVTPISVSSFGSLPGGFSISGAFAFEIQTTATFTGPVSITFTVPGPISQTDFNNLQVLHKIATGFEVLPTTRNFATLTITATTTSFSPFVIAKQTDITPPAISCGASDGLWHANDVSVACTASDTQSGLANPADASFNLTTSVPAGTETANASTNTRIVCDNAGNCTTAGPINGIKVDKKPPVITLTTPAANSNYIVNQSVTGSYTCTDGGSGVATCTGPVPNGAAVPTSAAGKFSFAVNAADAVGNISSQTSAYNIGYNICLLFDPTKARSVGSKYHFQIQLCDVLNRNVSSSSIVVTAISITATATSALLPLDTSDDSSAATLNFQFDPSLGGTGGYEFNLDTDGFPKGTFILTFRAGADPNLHTIQFQLR